jgi:hypothetical protein
MKFAKIVFRIAGIWGLLVIPPLYFMFDLIGRNDPPPITHPGFFYGFVGLALSWQIAFLVIATDPVRFRPLMKKSPSVPLSLSSSCKIVRTLPTSSLPLSICSSAFYSPSPTSRALLAPPDLQCKLRFSICPDP